MRQSLTSLDIATGTMIGSCRRPGPLPASDASARAELEREIMPALLRPPCLVSFSGGRDSSAVLAVAVDLARREGLALPIPATNVFPKAVHANETVWQDRVVAHLRIRDWLRLEHDNELDVLGPYARRVMLRHGLLLPFNVHFHLPLLDAARGGSLLTGVGGDELFTASCRARPALSGRPRLLPRDLARFAVLRAPTAVGSAVWARRNPVEIPWLHRDAGRAVAGALARMALDEPRSLRRRLTWWRGLRYLNDGRLGLALTAADADVRLVHPFLGPAVWAATGREAAPHGFQNRSDAMRRLFSDLLPDDLLSRSSKAHFNEAFWTDTARAFARGWNRTGVPVEHVDADALYHHWNSPEPLAQSFTLLQAAWLGAVDDRAKEFVDGALV